MEKVFRNTKPTKTGRPRKISEKDLDKIFDLYEKGMTQPDIAKKFKCSVATVRVAMRRRRNEEE